MSNPDERGHEGEGKMNRFRAATEDELDHPYGRAKSSYVPLSIREAGGLVERVWRVGSYEDAQEVIALQRERDRYAEALRQVRDGIFSGNQAAEWARQALAHE